MSRSKTILSILLILGLGSLCYLFNRDSFVKRPIQIAYRVSPWLKNSSRARARTGGDVGVPVVFTLDHYYKLTSMKVVKAEEFATNKFAHPLWELTTESNSIPTSSFSYGDRIPGLHPTVKGARADPLEPYVMYRLILKTINDSAEHNFTTTPPSELGSPAPAAAK